MPAQPASPPERPEFGALLRHWRGVRGHSQLDLSLHAQVSSRHVSFLETGRARPSEAMIATLVAALQLPRQAENALRIAAGYAPAPGVMQPSLPALQSIKDGDIAGHMFETLLAFEDAASVPALIQHAMPTLAAFGMQHFFFATVATAANGNSTIVPENHGAFPTAWLGRYRTQGYDTVDPLVDAAAVAHSGFFWADVLGREKLRHPADRMFRDAANVGLHGGFITGIRNADGTVKIVSMMGEGNDHRDRRVRVALQTLGLSLLDRLERIGQTVLRPVLTDDVLECLRWTMTGRKPGQIAEKLGVSENTVRARISKACRELGASNARQAAARAVALNLLRSA